MKKLPHHYEVKAFAKPLSDVSIQAERVATLTTDAPEEFGGSGKFWSPETLFVAAVADCFVLTFKAVSKASKFEWIEITCKTEGILDKVDNKLMFTEIIIQPKLFIKKGTSKEKAEKLLEKTEKSCLITNSIKSKISLVPSIVEV